MPEGVVPTKCPPGRSIRPPRRRRPPQASPAPASRSRLSSSLDSTSISRTARRRTSGGRGSRSSARWITKRDRSMPLSAAARPILSHSASVAITARWRRPLAPSFMVAIRLKKPASTVTHQAHLGNPDYETSQEYPHDQMTRITYRLRTEPIYLTIKIILMSHPGLHTHIPECNSSMTHNQILCRSNHPHPSLTTTLSHCIITLLQEKPATPHQPQCTEYHN